MAGKTKVALVLPERIIGIDFSGAPDAGNKIWIAVTIGRIGDVERDRRDFGNEA